MGKSSIAVLGGDFLLRGLMWVKKTQAAAICKAMTRKLRAV
ncbi:hypothetical protein [Janthinobacterium violaceinigrum]|nr:hypothetical protein [Janthinobacterium violaceinigrum]